MRTGRCSLLIMIGHGLMCKVSGDEFFPGVLIRCYYRKCFRHHFFSASFLTLRKRVAVEYLYVSSRQTTMNEKGSIRKFPFACPVTALPVSYRRCLNSSTALSTTPAGHPGLPAATCVCFVGLLPIKRSVLLILVLRR